MWHSDTCPYEWQQCFSFSFVLYWLLTRVLFLFSLLICRQPFLQCTYPHLEIPKFQAAIIIFFVHILAISFIRFTHSFFHSLSDRPQQQAWQVRGLISSPQSARCSQFCHWSCHHRHFRCRCRCCWRRSIYFYVQYLFSAVCHISNCHPILLTFCFLWKAENVNSKQWTHNTATYLLFAWFFFREKLFMITNLADCKVMRNYRGWISQLAFVLCSNTINSQNITTQSYTHRKAYGEQTHKTKATQFISSVECTGTCSVHLTTILIENCNSVWNGCTQIREVLTILTTNYENKCAAQGLL